MRVFSYLILAVMIVGFSYGTSAAINCNFKGGKFEDGFRLCQCPVRFMQGGGSGGHMIISEQLVCSSGAWKRDGRKDCFKETIDEIDTAVVRAQEIQKAVCGVR